jgi:hypothetical protein
MNTGLTFALSFKFENKHYEGEAVSASSVRSFSANPAFDIFLHNEYEGTITKTGNHWTSDNHFDKG